MKKDSRKGKQKRKRQRKDELDQIEALVNEEILKAIAGSEKSYEEILSFIQGKTDTDSREEE